MSYGVKVLQCIKKLTASLEIKLVNISCASALGIFQMFLSGLAYGVNEGLSRAERMFQV